MDTVKKLSSCTLQVDNVDIMDKFLSIIIHVKCILRKN